MTQQDILDIARLQSAEDLNCRAEDFLKTEHVIVHSAQSIHARKYLKLPFSCHLVSYGTNIVASVQAEYKALVGQYINKFKTEHCFETPNLYVLNEAFMPYGQRVCFMAEYFLPVPELLRDCNCGYELRVLQQEDFTDLYVDTWSNALCEKRKELDVLGVGAYDHGTLAGLAACSADCDTMWQIGIDVLPQYRQKGIARALTSRLAMEILQRGKVPFYCAAWSNIRSVRNALSSGFRPAWIEMTVKPDQFVNEMNAESQNLTSL